MATGQINLIGKDKTWKPFIINISLIIVLFLVGIFIGFIIRTNHLFNNQLITTARSYFKNIVLTRRWNANYGGVFIKKTEGVISNPYLEKPDIKTVDGDVYTKKNPALMTREISEYAEKAGDFKFHITSLKPLNPNNTPDEFEKNALMLFEKGREELFVTENKGASSIFRYMAPLFVEQDCLGCHAKQGYKPGDVRGGISVQFDITDIKHEMTINKVFIVTLSILTTIVLLTIIYFLILRLARRLSEAYSTIEKMSVTDELTQIYNRRYFHNRLSNEIARAMRYGHSLSLVLLDIDHFKKVNDTYGHQAGDKILFQVATNLKTNCRKIDIVARYGGEELVIILPETDVKGAESLAEKIRESIECQEFDIGDDKSINITASLGVSCLRSEEISGPDDEALIVKWADEALYSAKKNGRNRSEVYTKNLD